MLVTANIFQPLIDVFESVLKAFHSGGLSWGWSIVLLTVAVRAVLVPLTYRQIKGMVRMQGLAPQMKAIQAKYKDDKQRQQQEIMNFYKENNVNPLSSCLPMVLQLPVFVSLYYMLRKSLRYDICRTHQLAYQAQYKLTHHVSAAKAASETTACGNSAATHFLFIHDLTAKATGIELGILIVLYIGSQLGSTLVMSAATTMDPMQRRLMMFMPLVFVLFIVRFPAGLMVYWITTNLWTVAQQYTVRRYIGPTVAVNAPDAAAGGGGDAKALSYGDGPNGGGGSGGGGFGARMRERLTQAQSDADAKGRPDSGSSASSRATATATETKAPARQRTRKSGGGSNGNGAGVKGSGNGSSSSSERSSSTPPPRSPRKKKKRSGRRR